MKQKIPKVFICEDDESIIEIVTMVLKEKGYIVESSTDGKTAIKKIKEVKPDILLVDLWLPIYSGIEVIKKIRTFDGFAQIPTILFSANREVERISKELETSDFLHKPFDIFELESKIEKLIN